MANFRIAANQRVVLDALRAGSAFAVVANHCLIYALTAEGDPHSSIRRFAFFTEFGHQAVVVFFALSGFLVGAKSIESFCWRDRSISSYCIDRVTRIYTVLAPALLIGGMLDCISGWIGPTAGFDSGAAWKSISLAAFFGNLSGLQGLLVPVFGSNAALWSLSYELWCYILFPIALLAFCGRSKSSRIAAVLFFVSALAVLPTALLKYCVFWLVGLSAWKPPRLNPLIPASLLAIFLAATKLGFSDIRTVGYGLYLGIAFSTALLIASFHGREGIESSLVAKCAGNLSAFSFSLYLIHYPVIHFFTSLIGGWSHFEPNPSAIFAIWAALMVMSYVGGYAAFLAFERRYHYLRGLLKREPAPLLGVAAWR